MPFKRKDSPYWQIRKYNLSGYGDTGAISTKSTDKNIALRMESLLVDIASKALIDSSWYMLLDGICKHEIDIARVLRAKNQRGLDKLRKSLIDPLISEAIQNLRSSQPVDFGANLGLKRIEEFAGSERVSDLTTKRITSLIYKYMEVYKVKQNTAVKKIKRGASVLLIFQYGQSRKRPDCKSGQGEDTG